MSGLAAGVGIVVPFLDHLGGTESLAWSLALTLRDAGFAPLVWTCEHRREPGLERRAAPGVEVVRRRVLQRAPLLDLTWIVPGSRSLGRALASCRAVLGYHLPTGGVLAALAARRAGRPFAVLTQGSGAMGDIEALRRMPFPAWRRRALAGAGLLGAVSADAERELVADGFTGAHLRRVPPGCDTGQFRPPSPEERAAARAGLGIDADRFVVAYTGRLHPQKRLDTLLEAARVLGPRGRLRILVTGEGPERERLERRADEAGLSGIVSFLGRLPDQRPVLRAADAFALPSASEGISVALLEAMAMGLAVLVSDIPGNDEVVRDGHDGLRVPVGNVPAWASALDRLGGNAERRLELGERARATVLERFDRARVEATLVEWVRSPGVP